MPTSFLFSLFAGKRWPLLFVLLLAGLASQAQAPAWQMATAVSQGSGSSYVRAAATGPDGSVYLVGVFSGTISIGPATLTSIGQSDAFVAKWNPGSASFVWAHRFGTTNVLSPTAIAVSGSSIYIAGTYRTPTLTFGNVTITNQGGTEAYVVKLTDSGNTGSFVWAQSIGYADDEYANGLAVNGNSVYITGSFASRSVELGATTLFNANLNGGPDIFVAKLLDAGSSSSFAWARQAGGTAAEQANSIAVQGSDVYITGAFYGPTTQLGTTTLTNADLMYTGGYNYYTADVFVAKLTDTGTAGNFVWAQHAGGPGPDQPNQLAVAGSSIYTVGSCLSSAGFGANSTLPTTAPYSVGFVAKLTDGGTTGTFVWSRQADSTGAFIPQSVVVRGRNVYTAGLLGSAETFVAKFLDAGTTGSAAWTQSASSAQGSTAYTLALSNNRVYVAGYVHTSATFGSHLVTGPPLAPVGFLASLTDQALPTAAPAQLPGLALYPNPARARATVQLPAVPGAGQATLTLTDALGRTVQTFAAPLPASGLRHELDLTRLAPGLYALRVQAGTAQAIRWLTVE